MTTLARNRTNQPAAHSRRRLGALRARRRGFTSVATLMMIVIGIVTLMLVVNWTYLVLVSRHTLRLSDTLALSAVRELLDEGRLQDVPVYMQADDIDDAVNLITADNTGLLAQNTAAMGVRLRPTASDLTIKAGRIDDASQPVGGANAFVDPVGSQPYNSLRVEILRSPTGLNPVQLLMRGFGAPEAAKISSSSLATLDSRVIGFRPSVSTPAPVAPLAIDQNAWFSTRVSLGSDTHNPPLRPANGRLEWDFLLRTPGGDGAANAALVGLQEGGSLNLAAIPAQIADGIYPSDVHASGLLGPATVGDPMPLPAARNSPPGMATIAAAFQAVADSAHPERVFPLYSGAYSDPLDIVGFIGARVMQSDVVDLGDGPQLRVRLEPAFIVHSTVATARLDATPADVPENLYIHKIRLTR